MIIRFCNCPVKVNLASGSVKLNYVSMILMCVCDLLLLFDMILAERPKERFEGVIFIYIHAHTER